MDRYTPPADMAACLRALARTRPADTALVVVGRRGELHFDYATLDRRACALAAALRRQCAPGERALLLLENDEHYVTAFFACLYAGVIAVPVFPPEGLREQALARLAVIAADAGAACILATSGVLAAAGNALERLGVAGRLAVDSVAEEEGAGWQPHVPRADDIAFLQYTSGSTAAPKGVMVSHGNLMANGRAISEGMDIGPADTMVSWLPLYHDMGLIGGMLQPFYTGAKLVLMSPAWFIERPLRWLEALARHRGTVSGAPDFGFRLCLDRIRPGQAEALDLSQLRVLYSGAEPVREATLAQFCARFAGTQLDPAALYPCYGLAEATLYVSGARRGAGMRATGFDAAALARGRAVLDTAGPRQVACGYAAQDHAVAIVDPQTQAFLPEGEVGEIWTAGPSIAQGYWRNPEATAAAFAEHGGRRWLRTGDLGFMHAGQLHISGRRKDLIILRGQNVYPQDLELALEAGVEAIRRGRVAAFAVPRAEGDGIGVALEVAKAARKSHPPQALLERIVTVLAETCQEPPAVVLLLEPGSLPKTSSGKLQRAACRSGWQDGSLAAYAVYQSGAWTVGGDAAPPGEGPRPGVEAALAQLWTASIGRPVLERDAHFFASGGNSLAAAQLVARIRAQWRLDYTLAMLFAAPRLCEMATALEELERGGRHAEDAPIVALERGARPLAASFAQGRQWLLWQLDRNSSAYHIGGALRLQGRLDLDRLQLALTLLAQRHETLRTVYVQGDDGMLAQRILPAQAVTLASVDLRGLDRDDAEAAAAAQAQAWLAQPFDLEGGTPWRTGLVRLDEDRHLLVVVIHHIAADAASLQVLVDEWASLYGATDPAVALAPPSLGYADYAAWQRAWLEGGEGERQLAWWRAELGGSHPVLALQADAPRRAHAAWPAAQWRFAVPRDLSERLRNAAGGRTLFTLLLAGFQALLHRYSGMVDLRIGVPVANRGRPELASMVGMFVNTQLLRSVADGRTTLGALLAQTATRLAGAQANQELPFEQLLEALRADGALGRDAPFEVMFNHLREPRRASASAGTLALATWEIPAQAAQCELVLETLEQPDGSLDARLVYAQGLFSQARMERLAAHYLRMLDAIASEEAPGVAIGDVALLDAGELGWEAQRGHAAPPAGDAAGLLADLIAAQAARTPDALALVDGATCLGYAELERRATRLAQRLRAHGAVPEARVAVALERGANLVVGLLAVLKTGAAYVPLDPGHPRARLEWMLTDSGATILLTQASLRDALPAMDTLVLDEADAEDAPAFAAPSVQPANLAYLIYTSGSTGAPKGVAVSHGALAAHARAMAAYHGLNEEDRVLLFSSVCFDAAADQLWAPLLAGAAVVVGDPARLDAASLLALVRSAGITVLDLPPAYLRQLGATFAGQTLPLRLCIAGGEGWSASALAAAHAALPGVQLVNAYGPTEAVVTASAWRGAACASAYAPLGLPLGGRSAWVLDAELNPLPRGQAGELCLGGALLARGYLGRPGLSAERFVADPHGAPGARLYRTADLVRWNADGQLEYLGRLDHQVKVRGYRVEPGEVEAGLLALAGVREAVVTARAEEGESVLAAYVAPQSGVTLDAAALKRALAAALPAYMVPSSVAVLERLPTGAGGKVDRAALPAPTRAGTAWSAPQGEIEEALARLWAEVLGHDRPGRDDNFFEAGGHSLKAMELAALLQARHGWQAPLRSFFEWPVLADHAREVLAPQQGTGARPDAIDNLLAEFEV